MQGPKHKLLLGVARGNVVESLQELALAAETRIPVVGCRGTRVLIDRWTVEGRPWIYRDRGYLRRGRMARSGLAAGAGEGYWRWHLGTTQLDRVAPRPSDRFARLGIAARPWRRGGRHILVAEPSATLAVFHGLAGWGERTVAALRRHTDRPILVRPKPPPRGPATPLAADLKDAHALVTHTSNAAVEAAVLGVPIFVDPASAARHVGLTDIAKIETPVYPDRDAWLAALAYCQFSEAEMLDGTMWRLLE
jgi:hypothetical protein